MKTTTSGKSTTSSSRKRAVSKRGEGTAVRSPRSQKNEEGTLMDLFEDQLRDIYWVERQLTKALPKISKAADSDEFKEAIENHLSETEEQLSRLDQVFEKCDIKPQARKSDAMEGLIMDSSRIIEEFTQGPLRDAALIIAAQKVEHYEIAAYGSLCTLASLMDKDDVKDLLGSNLEEEKNADQTLTSVAEGINVQAQEKENDSNQEVESTSEREEE